MSDVFATSTTVSVTEASRRGVAHLVRTASEGDNVIVSRRGDPVAAVVGMGRLAELEELERDLRSAALVFARALTATGERTSLDDAIAALGFDRATLEAELHAEMAADPGSTNPGSVVIPEKLGVSDVVDLLREAAGSRPAIPEPPAPDPAPKWLEKRLRGQVGLSDEQVSELDLEEAVDAWTDFQTRGR